MGVYEKSAGVYRVVLVSRNERRDWIVRGTKRDAEDFEAKMRVELRVQGRASLRVVPTFLNFCVNQYQPHARRQLKASTVRNRQYILRDFMDAFGHLRLDEITTEEIEGYVDRRQAAGMKATTINTELRTLKRVLNYARELDILVPPIRAKLLPERGMRKVRAWTTENIEALYAVCERLHPQLLPMLVFLANTGCRKGEALALEWENVDLERRIVTIWPSEEWQPKDKDARYIPVNDVLHGWLKALPRSSRYVFPCPPEQTRSAQTPAAVIAEIGRRARAGEKIAHIAEAVGYSGLALEQLLDDQLAWNSAVTRWIQGVHATDAPEPPAKETP